MTVSAVMKLKEEGNKRINKTRDELGHIADKAFGSGFPISELARKRFDIEYTNCKPELSDAVSFRELNTEGYFKAVSSDHLALAKLSERLSGRDGDSRKTIDGLIFLPRTGGSDNDQMNDFYLRTAEEFGKYLPELNSQEFSQRNHYGRLEQECRDSVFETNESFIKESNKKLIDLENLVRSSDGRILMTRYSYANSSTTPGASGRSGVMFELRFPELQEEYTVVSAECGFTPGIESPEDDLVNNHIFATSYPIGPGRGYLDESGSANKSRLFEQLRNYENKSFRVSVLSPAEMNAWLRSP